jgi:hypothetical protein
MIIIMTSIPLYIYQFFNLLQDYPQENNHFLAMSHIWKYKFVKLFLHFGYKS